MLENTSLDSRNKILIEITKVLIENSKSQQLKAIEESLIQKRKERAIQNTLLQAPKLIYKPLVQQPRQIIPQERKPLTPQETTNSEWEKSPELSQTQTQEKEQGFENVFTKVPTPQRTQQYVQPLQIPEPVFPERLRYLQPTPTNTEISLGKLDNFLKDPMVRTVECNGPNTNIIVRNPNPRTTDVTLTKEEINEVIKKFSDSSKIPLNEGVLRIASGKYILSAIYSEIIGSKFIIKKINLFPKPN